MDAVQIRILSESDPETISAEFRNIGWGKLVAQYECYLAEQTAGSRICFVANVDGKFAGYVTVNWAPQYIGAVELGIPEIEDLNVLPAFRRKGIGTRLLERAEEEVALRSNVVGIAVGLHPAYNAAQRLYVKRGYIPAGPGVTYPNNYVHEGTPAVPLPHPTLPFTNRLLPIPPP